MQELWSAVDAYVVGALHEDDPALEAALAASDAEGLPPFHVAPNQGKTLHLLARAIGARRILEVGTLAGYSAIWLARALPPGGEVVTIEVDPRHAEVARANLARAGVADRVDVRVGRAADVLPTLAGPFDLVFVDADKASNADYFAWAVRLSRPGTIVVVDNVVREGAVLDAASEDPSVRGVRRLVEAIRAEPRVDATALQTVGSKGHDGFVLALVR